MHVVQVNLDADCSLAKTHKEIAADDVLLPHLGGEVGEDVCREAHLDCDLNKKSLIAFFNNWTVASISSSKGHYQSLLTHPWTSRRFWHSKDEPPCTAALLHSWSQGREQLNPAGTDDCNKTCFSLIFHLDTFVHLHDTLNSVQWTRGVASGFDNMVRQDTIFNNFFTCGILTSAVEAAVAIWAREGKFLDPTLV